MQYQNIFIGLSSYYFLLVNRSIHLQYQDYLGLSSYYFLLVNRSIHLQYQDNSDSICRLCQLKLCYRRAGCPSPAWPWMTPPVTSATPIQFRVWQKPVWISLLYQVTCITKHVPYPLQHTCGDCWTFVVYDVLTILHCLFVDQLSWIKIFFK